MGDLTSWYWIAIRRPDYRERKKGTSSLGVIIVEAAGPHHAWARAQQFGAPNGEWKMWHIPDAPPEKYRNRMLRDEEAKELNLVLKELAS